MSNSIESQPKPEEIEQQKSKQQQELQAKIEPVLAQLYLTLQTQSIQYEPSKIKSQLIRVILSQQIKKKSISRDSANNSQIIFNDSLQKSQTNLQVNIHDLQQGLCKYREFFTQIQKNKQQIRNLQTKLCQTQIKLQNQKIINDSQVKKINEMQEQLTKNKAQIKQHSQQKKQLFSRYEDKITQLENIKQKLHQQNQQYLKDIEKITYDKQRDTLSYEILALKNKLGKSKTLIQSLENQKHTLSTQVENLNQKIRQLENDKQQSNSELHKSLNIIQKSKSQHQRISQDEIKKNKASYQDQVKNWILEQQSQISVQMNNWFSKLRDETTAPLLQQIQALKQQNKQIIPIQQQLEQTKEQLKKSQQSILQKDQQIKNLKENIAWIQQLKNDREEMIKKISQLILSNRQRFYEEKILNRIEEKLKKNLQQKMDLQKKLKDKSTQTQKLVKQLYDFRADIRNINSSLLNSDKITKEDSEKILKLTCKNADHIESLSKYYQRIQLIIKENVSLSQALQQVNSKLKIIESQRDDLKQKYERKQQQANTLNSQYTHTLTQLKQRQTQTRQLKRKHEEKLKIIQDLQSTLEAQKIQINSQLNVKQQFVIKINKELSEAKEKITQQKNKIQELQQSQKRMKSQVQRCNRQSYSSESTINKLKSQTKALQQQLMNHRRTEQLQMRSLQEAIRSVTGKEQANSINHYDSLLRFLQENKPATKSGPFVFSSILLNLDKQQQKLESYVKKFFQTPNFLISSSYRFDEFNKNFLNYLPIKSSYSFIIIVRSKKGQIFGAISTGIGKSQRACIFNLNSGKTFQSDKEMNSTVYDSGFLMFGQGEMRFKNNANLEGWVNSKIFNTRCFTFKRDEIVGPNEDGDSIQLSELEIHRIEK